MNKYTFLVVFLCTLALTNAKPSSDETEKKSSESNDMNELRKAAQELRDKYNITIGIELANMIEKIDEQCPDLEQKLMAAADETQKCIEEIELGSETFCSLIKTHFLKCFKPTRELMTSCMPKESKELPEMLSKIMVSIVDHACHSTIEEVLEWFNQCIWEKNVSEIPECKEIMKLAFKQEHKQKLPSKSLICDTLPKIKSCLKAMVNGSCKNKVTINSVLKFHDDVENAVKNECDTLNEA